MGKPISRRLDDKFESVFRIRIAWLYQSVRWNENTSKFPCCACVRQRWKILLAYYYYCGVGTIFGKNVYLGVFTLPVINCFVSIYTHYSVMAVVLAR